MGFSHSLDPTRTSTAQSGRSYSYTSSRSPMPPAGFLPEARKKLRRVGLLRLPANPAVQLVRIVADQDAPLPGLHGVEDDLRRLHRRHRRLIAKGARAIAEDSLHLLVR